MEGKRAEIYTNMSKIEKLNLLMGITPNKIICCSIKDKTVDSSYFLEFMEEVVKKIGISDINKYIFILDNATIHLDLNFIIKTK